MQQEVWGSPRLLWRLNRLFLLFTYTILWMRVLSLCLSLLCCKIAPAPPCVTSVSQAGRRRKGDVGRGWICVRKTKASTEILRLYLMENYRFTWSLWWSKYFSLAYHIKLRSLERKGMGINISRYRISPGLTWWLCWSLNFKNVIDYSEKSWF